MKTDLTRQPARSAYPPKLPEIEKSTALLFDFMALEDPATYGMPTAYSKAVQDEARSRLEQLARYTRPITPAELLAWIEPVLAAVPNPKPEAQIPAWMAALSIAMAEAPIGAFTLHAQRTFLRSQRFFPSVADVFGAVAENIAWLKRETSILATIATGATRGGA